MTRCQSCMHLLPPLTPRSATRCARFSVLIWMARHIKGPCSAGQGYEEKT